jgi:hypothetical protein
MWLTSRTQIAVTFVLLSVASAYNRRDEDCSQSAVYGDSLQHGDGRLFSTDYRRANDYMVCWKPQTLYYQTGTRDAEKIVNEQAVPWSLWEFLTVGRGRFFATTPEGAKQLSPCKSVTLRCEVILGSVKVVEWKGPLLLGQRKALGRATAVCDSIKIISQGPHVHYLVFGTSSIRNIHVHSASASNSTEKHSSLVQCRVRGVDVPLCHLSRLDGFVWLGAFIILLQLAAGVATVALQQVNCMWVGLGVLYAVCWVACPILMMLLHLAPAAALVTLAARSVWYRTREFNSSSPVRYGLPSGL